MSSSHRSYASAPSHKEKPYAPAASADHRASIDPTRQYYERTPPYQSSGSSADAPLPSSSRERARAAAQQAAQRTYEPLRHGSQDAHTQLSLNAVPSIKPVILCWQMRPYCPSNDPQHEPLDGNAALWECTRNAKGETELYKVAASSASRAAVKFARLLEREWPMDAPGPIPLCPIPVATLPHADQERAIDAGATLHHTVGSRLVGTYNSETSAVITYALVPPVPHESKELASSKFDHMNAWTTVTICHATPITTEAMAIDQVIDVHQWLQEPNSRLRRAKIKA